MGKMGCDWGLRGDEDGRAGARLRRLAIGAQVANLPHRARRAWRLGHGSVVDGLQSPGSPAFFRDKKRAGDMRVCSGLTPAANPPALPPIAGTETGIRRTRRQLARRAGWLAACRPFRRTASAAPVSVREGTRADGARRDRKSTRLNSSHLG